MRQGMIRVLIPLVLSAVVLTGIVALGQLARDALRDDDRYSFPFAEVSCDVPPDLDRGTFLSQIQARGGLPDRLSWMDAELAERLAAAFRRHPRVQSVDRVEASRAAGVNVRLTFRTAVLAVPLPLSPGTVPPEQTTWISAPSVGSGGREKVACRVVDRTGVLLARQPTDRLPILLGVATQPRGDVGESFGDPRVEMSAAVVGEVAPHLRQLGLEDCYVRVEDGSVTLEKPLLKVVWGRPPGRETAGEAKAAVKAERLLHLHGGRGDLSRGTEYDLRPTDAPVQRELRGP